MNAWPKCKHWGFVYLFPVFSLLFSSGSFYPVNGQELIHRDELIIPDGKALPEWLNAENLCFSRLDGGYIERQKAIRTKWGQGWESEEYEVLENIYLKYSDNIIKKLKQGGINVIWVTWSNGWSLDHEAAQREHIKAFIEKCHQSGIKVLAYICSTNIFWENMFLDYPIALDITRRQPSGIPYTYHGENPLRYVANMNHPAWIDLEKKRIGLALDAGIDGFFFDNPLSGGQPVVNQVYFFNEIQKFIKLEKNRPDVPITSNFGLQPEYQDTNQQLDFTFNEFGRQPGVYDDIWVNGNIKKIKYIKSFLPRWKTAMHEANYFPGGQRERAFMPPKAQKLARAEAAAFGAAYVNFIEGRLLTDLIHDNREALESWRAVGQYNRFLSTNASYYTDAIQPHRTIVLIPDDTGFTFDRIEAPAGPLLDYLSRHNVLYNIKKEGELQPGDLDETGLLIVPGYLKTSRRTAESIGAFKSHGGKVLGIGGNQFIRDISDRYFSWTFLEKMIDGREYGDTLMQEIRALARDFTVDIRNAPNTLVNVTRQDAPARTLIHLINYNDRTLNDVVVKVDTGSAHKQLNISNIHAFSPDSEGNIITDLKINGSYLEFRVPGLDTYVLIVIDF